MIVRYERPRDWISCDRMAIFDELMVAKAAMLVLTCNNKQFCKVVDGKTHQTLGSDRG